MDEIYQMLGREHQADLEREAAKWRRARDVAPREDRGRRWTIRRGIATLRRMRSPVAARSATAL
jgi:hypothetical protein